MPMNPRLLRPTSSTLDRDAAVYLNAVAQADQQQLEPAVRKAVNDFVVGCKRDGIWGAIKACCLLAGPRTLAGINVPLVGPTPTFNAFEAADYNRGTGLVGNGTTKSIDSGRNNNADPQDNQHLALWVHSSPAGEGRALLSAAAETGRSAIINASGSFASRSRNTVVGSNTASFSLPGFVGVSRGSSSEYIFRHGGSNLTQTQASQAPGNSVITVYNATGGNARTASRIAYYSIGEHLDLALLEVRVSAYMTAIGAAI